jgi:NAD(P)-dependent dehydrogenase (short-subunit alcohol dehydrogenase family)
MGKGKSVAGRLATKTALVTGAGSGIGRAIAQRFMLEGARVVFTDRDKASVVGACAEVDGDCVALEMDISNEASVQGAFAQAIESGFRPDVVVANAGIQLFGKDARVADLDLEVWNQTIGVNLTGTFLTLKHAVRAMLQTGGSIIVTGSPTALSGEFSDFTAYASSKGGVHSLALAVAGGYASDGIRVNTVIPGYTETPLVQSVINDAEARSTIVERIPLKRAGTPQDVEGIMVFLASDESSYATGSMFVLDGGLTTL